MFVALIHAGHIGGWLTASIGFGFGFLVSVLSRLAFERQHRGELASEPAKPSALRMRRVTAELFALGAILLAGWILGAEAGFAVGVTSGYISGALLLRPTGS